jgi:hypothetical protein
VDDEGFALGAVEGRAGLTGTRLDEMAITERSAAPFKPMPPTR